MSLWRRCKMSVVDFERRSQTDPSMVKQYSNQRCKSYRGERDISSGVKVSVLCGCHHGNVMNIFRCHISERFAKTTDRLSTFLFTVNIPVNKPVRMHYNYGGIIAVLSRLGSTGKKMSPNGTS